MPVPATDRAAKAAVTSIGETFEIGPDGIGTTIAFPSGMVLADLADPADLDSGEAAWDHTNLLDAAFTDAIGGH